MNHWRAKAKTLPTGSLQADASQTGFQTSRAPWETPGKRPPKAYSSLVERSSSSGCAVF